MVQFNDLSPDSLNAELNYRREQLTGGRRPGQARTRWVRNPLGRARRAA